MRDLWYGYSKQKEKGYEKNSSIFFFFITGTKVITNFLYLLEQFSILELNDLRNIDRVTINAISPRPINRCLNASVALPHSTVAFKPTPERYLPHPITPTHFKIYQIHTSPTSCISNTVICLSLTHLHSTTLHNALNITLTGLPTWNTNLQ